MSSKMLKPRAKAKPKPKVKATPKAKTKPKATPKAKTKVTKEDILSNINSHRFLIEMLREEIRNLNEVVKQTNSLVKDKLQAIEGEQSRVNNLLKALHLKINSMTPQQIKKSFDHIFNKTFGSLYKDFL